MKTKGSRTKIRNWFKTRKLKQKVRLLFASIIVAYFLVFVLIYNLVIKGSIHKYIEQSNCNTMVSIGNNLNGDFQTMNTMGQLIFNNQDVIKYLKSGEGRESIGAYKAMTSIYGITTSFDKISSVYVLKGEKNSIDISNGITKVDYNVMEEASWNEIVEKRAGRNVIMLNGNGLFQQTSGKPVISFIRVFNDIQTQKPIGKLAINCSIDMLEDAFKELETGNKSFAFYDDTGNYLCGKSEIKLLNQNIVRGLDEYKSVYSGGNKAAYYYRIPNAPIIVVEWEEISYFKYLSSQTFIIIILFIAVTGICFVGISLFIKRFITKPMESLVYSMEEVKSGWLKRVSLELPDDEIGKLKNSYNNMLVEINDLIEELLEKEKNMQQAEIEALQEQIKPHFLYNTLDTIAYLSLETPREDVYDAIETLGNFYRKFLSKGSKEITIQDEVAIVKDYLKLQKLRYEDIFEEEYLIQKELQKIKVPKLILQPLVENSLYHGVRLKGEKCLIKIEVYRVENEMYIKVYDTGVGMSEFQMQNFMKENSKSFGLRKTIERIQHYYNKNDIYEVHSQEGYFCEVIIKIPLEGENEKLCIKS